jgi:hypothetical protein
MKTARRISWNEKRKKVKPMNEKMLLTAVLAAAACACAVGGPKTTLYIRADHPAAKGRLVDEVSLHYAVETTPGEAEIIGHVAETGRGASCEDAAVDALEKMQKEALEKGGNALVALKATWKDKPAGDEKGFRCSQVKDESGSPLWAVTWEGDIARLGGAPGAAGGGTAAAATGEKQADKQPQDEAGKQMEAPVEAVPPVAAQPSATPAPAKSAIKVDELKPKRAKGKKTMETTEDEKAEEAF